MVVRSSTLSQNATLVQIPKIANDSPGPKPRLQITKKKTKVPALTVMPTFHQTAAAVVSGSDKKPVSTTTSTKQTSTKGAPNASLTTKEKLIIGRISKNHRNSAFLRLDQEKLKAMNISKLAQLIDSRLSAIEFKLETWNEKQMLNMCKATTSALKTEKIWQSPLLNREVDILYLEWSLYHSDPAETWTPPFAHTEEWKIYSQEAVVTSQFSMTKKVAHDLDRFWILCRDIRDKLDQKKMKLVRGHAKQYNFALNNQRQHVLTSFVTLQEFHVTKGWEFYIITMVQAIGLKKSVESWLTCYKMRLPERGIIALGLILENVISENGGDIRADFKQLWKQAVKIRKDSTRRSTQAAGTQLFDWMEI